MKFFIPLICILAMTVAEPPVGDGYPAARSHSHGHDHENHIDHHDHASNLQRSPSQEYGVPSARSFGSPSQEYGVPSARLSGAHNHGELGHRSTPSQQYGAPNTRSSLSQEYGPPGFRSNPSSGYAAAARGLSQEYGVPSTRSSEGYPSARGLSQEYGVPSTRTAADSYARSPSTEYGVPELRNAEQGYSQGYSAATRASSSSYLPPSSTSQFRSSPSQEYGVPRSSQGYPASRSSFRSSGLRSHSAPASSVTRNFAASPRFGASNALSTQYGVPSARSDSYLEGYKVSQTYGVPSQRSPSETYGVPSEESIGQEPAVIAARSGNLKTTALASSYPSARSSPSAKYGAPSISARDSMPSEQYGVPDSENNVSGQGYNYARNALDELLNQEPANYDFAYKVNDLDSGSDFGHTETRQDNRAEGSYFVLLPDGTKQVVEYEADERGFKPRISVQPIDAREGGYDENASDLTRSGDGPY